MPQLNPATFVSQIFWLIISFLMMWLIIGRFVVPKINDVMRQRQRKTSDYIFAANEFRQRAEKLSMRYNNALNRAEKEAAQYLSKSEDAVAEQKRRLQKETEERIGQHKLENDKYLQQIKTSMELQVEELSSLLAEKILTRLDLTSGGYQEVAAALRKDKKND